MELTTQLKKRFCKDNNLPIKVYKEPYFMDRIKLFDKYFDCVNKLELFKEELRKFNNEQDYFEYYNKVKDDFINNLKGKAEYQEFISFDMNKFSVPNYAVGRKTVFKDSNDGKRLISIDLKKGNFSAMKFFNKALVDNKETYRDFISQFTDLEHIINSKYIRQVIFGNCNPKRQVTIEKYMMHFVMEVLLNHIDLSLVDSYMSDEIVFHYNEGLNLESLYEDLDTLQKEKEFKLHYEDYVVRKIPNTEFFVRHISNGEIDFKCVNHLFYPLAARAYNGEEVKESDLVFYHEGYFSKFIEVPSIEVV